MSYWMLNYIMITAASIFFGALIIPNILLIAFRCHLYDEPDGRKIHKGVIPRLGGISFLPSLGVALTLTIGLNMRFCGSEMGEALGGNALTLLFLAAALLIIYVLGIADDLIGVRYRAKFLYQVVAGILIVSSGLWINDLYGFLWIDRVPDWLGIGLTIFVIIYVLNAMNLIDGIDGLASGLSIVALGWYSYLFYNAQDYISLLLAGAALGTIIPFFYYNVFGKAATHTKIFMGDTGSLTIGLILVYLSLKIMNLTPDGAEADHNLLILAIVPLLLPCFDVVRVFMHRVREGRNPFLPDKSHIHHKLLALGFRQSKALIIILISDAILIMLNYLASSCVDATWIIVCDIIIWTLCNLYLTSAIRRREKRIGEKLY